MKPFKIILICISMAGIMAGCAGSKKSEQEFLGNHILRKSIKSKETGISELSILKKVNSKNFLFVVLYLKQAE